MEKAMFMRHLLNLKLRVRHRISIFVTSKQKCNFVRMVFLFCWLALVSMYKCASTPHHHAFFSRLNIGHDG